MTDAAEQAWEREFPGGAEILRTNPDGPVGRRYFVSKANWIEGYRAGVLASPNEEEILRRAAEIMDREAEDVERRAAAVGGMASPVARRTARDLRLSAALAALRTTKEAP